MDDRQLSAAWEQIEKNMLTEAAKVKTKKVAEDAAVPAPTAGGSMTQTGNAAQFKQVLGKKVKNVKEGKGDADLDSAKSNLAKAINTQAQKGITPIAEEEPVPTEPLPPGADELATDIENGVDSPEAEVEDENVISKIKQMYPDAIITISVQMPEETPFDTDVVASAQEVVGTEEPETAPVDTGTGDENLPDNLVERRKVIISRTRKHIKEMFATAKEADEVPGDVPAETPVEAPVTPEAGTDVPPEGTQPVPEVEVTDTKIALAPEQWEQVLATNDLIGTDQAPEVPGEEPLPGEMDELVVKPTDVVDPKNHKATGTVPGLVRLAPQKPQVKVQKPMNESFNVELQSYADSLARLIRN